MLFCSGCSIFALQITSLSLKFKYPPRDCLSKESGFFYSEYKSSDDNERMKMIYNDAIVEV